MAVPSSLGEVAANTANFGGAAIQHAVASEIEGARRLLGGEPKQIPTLGERYQDITENEGFGRSLMRSIPRPTVEGITAGVKSIPSLLPGGETPSDAMARNRLDFQREELAMRDAHPAWARGGEIAGDVLSIIGARRVSGLDDVIRRIETKFGTTIGINTAEGLASDINRKFMPTVRRLGRAGLRATESGVEAAALDILKDPNADPLDTAAIAAGGQLVGSGALEGARGLLSGGPTAAGLKLSVAAVAAMGIIQTFKSATPGDRDRILESAESGFDKVAAMLGVGIGSAALGATRYGRGNVALSDQTRVLLDGLATVHRGSILSVLSDWKQGSAEQRSSVEKTLAAMAADPYYRGETEKEREIVSLIRGGAGLVKYETGGGF